MKYLMTLGLLAITIYTLSGQVFGNGNQTTLSRSMEGLRSIDVQFNADIVLDYSADEALTLSIDENIKDLVGITFKNGKLTLDQVKWIEPSKQPTIAIGTPRLKRVFQGTHSTTRIMNVNGQSLTLEGNVGRLIVSGNVEDLTVNVSGTELDLTGLNIDSAKLNLLDDSRVKLNQVNRLETEYEEDNRVVLQQQPKEYITRIAKGNKGSRINFEPNPDLRYIKFKIKNNSWKRSQLVVVGPKRDGNTFSYGFSMLPFTKKSEKWSVGTRIYSESRNGARTLLVTITEEDEDSIVSLFN